MTENVIELPEGKTEVSFSEIPWLIAKAITPEEIANSIKIVAVRKRHIPADMPYDEETVSEVIPIENLTDDDWSRLNLICGFADLPILWRGNALTDINSSDWGEYEKAIKEYLPEWELIPYSNSTLNIIANQHRDYLKDLILKNKAVVHDYLTHIPLQQPINLFALEKAYMTVSDFTEYAKNLKLTVIVGNPTTSGKVLQKIPVAKQQDDAILVWLIDNKYNPKALPKEPKGKSGVRKACCDALCKNFKLFSTTSVFYTAWDTNLIMQGHCIKNETEA